MGLGDEYVKNPNKSLIGSAYQKNLIGPWGSLAKGNFTVNRANKNIIK
jgi:hypothetical protein